jgi:hypothetical protein
LTRGAGSANVKLVGDKKKALKLINKAFSSGFSVFDRFEVIKERWRKFVASRDTFYGVIKSCYRLFIIPKYAKLLQKERFEILFQDFIPNNNFDIRVIVIGDRAFAIKRIVRKNDFRASGSGNIQYEKEHFNKDLILNSFEYARELEAQCIAFDYVFGENQNPLIVEISYGFAVEAYDPCVGYWDNNFNFYEGPFDSCQWMVDLVVGQIYAKSKRA